MKQIFENKMLGDKKVFYTFALRFWSTSFTPHEGLRKGVLNSLERWESGLIHQFAKLAYL